MTEEHKQDATAEPEYELTRRQLIRDALVFQGKLLIDGFRDLVLLPISVIATIVSLFQKKGKPGKQFYDVVVFGRKTERWIDLFSAADRVESKTEPEPVENIDKLVDRVEDLIVDEYRKGALTDSARNAIHKTLEAVKLRRPAKKKKNIDNENAT